MVSGAWLLWLVAALAGPAGAIPSTACDTAAAEAARRTGVPKEVLMAITRSETGRSVDGAVQPWPWTVNAAGTGHWFATRREAERFAAEQLARGEQSFDLGCFQINHRWHGGAFASVSDMLDPEKNALYAARFLQRLYAETGGWTDAAGAFHSRTPKHAERYKRRYREMRAALRSRPAITLAKVPPTPRKNAFPLLRQDGAAAPGSLAPLAATSRAFIPGLGS
ncbi:transglycosylase SLT domain-containing protein [Salipiger sp. P9]|uniref:transglycosylase SLT domain-containing protein n=1 Tax=Salipiger pentaromativorans TaxID=2943193 RepID=UPI002157892A|nr:transglycosylase SLT domain-containing protein [Salipiger pentaromativorans]MCR8549517.1 transglycosylase SLT domain-containing protein [Salipiger pentaromativorans]